MLTFMVLGFALYALSFKKYLTSRLPDIIKPIGRTYVLRISKTILYEKMDLVIRFAVLYV
jgi:hypothetical protein